MKAEVKVDFDITKVVSFAEGLVAPRELHATITGKELPYDVDLRLVFSLDAGRMVVDELICRPKKPGDSVTSDGLRRLPVAHLAHAAVFQAVTRLPIPALDRFDDPSEITAYGPTDEALKAVAAFYRLGFLSGAPPAVYVAENLELPRSTAGRWIQMARQRGFLGAAEPRRPGEKRGK